MRSYSEWKYYTPEAIFLAKLCKIPRSNLTKYLSDFYIFIYLIKLFRYFFNKNIFYLFLSLFFHHIVQSAWRLYCPRSCGCAGWSECALITKKFPHSDPPKLGPFPCFLKISTNAALFPNIFGCSLGPKITPVAPFIVRARNMGLNKAPYENVPDSLA